MAQSPVEVKLFEEGPAATVALLGKLKLFENDDDRGAVLLAKRLNHALYADYARENLSQELSNKIIGMREKYQPLVVQAPYEELVQNGTMNQLINEYMEFLVARSEAKLKRLESGELRGMDEHNAAVLDAMIISERKKFANLKGEQATYANGGDYAKAQLIKIKPVMNEKKYLPLGRIAALSGLVKDATPEVAADLTSDAIAASVAAGLLDLRQKFQSIPGHEFSPADRQTRLNMVALNARKLTPALSSVAACEREGTGLDKLTALRTLLSAQLHEAFSKESLTGDQLAGLEKAAQALIGDYAQVAASLAYHYLAEGPAANDERAKAVQANLQQAMEKSGLSLLDRESADQRAAVLARDSAQDLLDAVSGDARQAGLLNELAQAAGVAVPHAPLVARQQLIAKASSPEDFRTFAARVAGQGSAQPALGA